MGKFKIQFNAVFTVMVGAWAAFIIWDAGLKSLVDQVMAKIKG